MTVRFNTSTATIDEGEGYNIQLVAQGTFDQNFKVMLTFADGTASEDLICLLNYCVKTTAMDSCHYYVSLEFFVDFLF